MWEVYFQGSQGRPRQDGHARIPRHQRHPRPAGRARAAGNTRTGRVQRNRRKRKLFFPFFKKKSNLQRKIGAIYFQVVKCYITDFFLPFKQYHNISPFFFAVLQGFKRIIELDHSPRAFPATLARLVFPAHAATPGSRVKKASRENRPSPSRARRGRRENRGWTGSGARRGPRETRVTRGSRETPG